MLLKNSHSTAQHKTRQLQQQQQLLHHRKEYLAAFGLQNTTKYQVALLAERTGGIYDPEEHGGIHRDAIKVNRQRT